MTEEVIENTELIPEPSKEPGLFSRAVRVLSGWLGRQSVPRFLGLLFSNTRDLENQIADRDRQIAFLREEVTYYRSRMSEFQDSVLLSKGMVPIARPVPPQEVVTRSSGPKTPMQSLAVQKIADSMLQEWTIGDREAVEQKVELLTRSKNYKDREVLATFLALIESLPLEGEGGVVITSGSIS